MKEKSSEAYGGCLRAVDVVVADQFGGGVGDRVVCSRVVEQRREDQAEIHLRRGAEARWRRRATMRRIACSICVIVSRFMTRTVPDSVAVCGMTL